MEKERLYEVTIEECCDTRYCNSCRVATVSVKAKCANAACDKALEKAKKEIKLDGLFASVVRCVGELML